MPHRPSLRRIVSGTSLDSKGPVSSLGMTWDWPPSILATVCGHGGRYNTMSEERVDISNYRDRVRLMILTVADVCGVAP